MEREGKEGKKRFNQVIRHLPTVTNNSHAFDISLASDIINVSHAPAYFRSFANLVNDTGHDELIQVQGKQ